MNNIKALREKHKITQKELANILNLSQNAISKYEHEVVEPDITTLIRMAEFFNTTIDNIVGVEIDKIQRLKESYKLLDKKALLEIVFKQIDALLMLEKNNK